MAKKKIYQLDANSSVASTQVLPLSGASSGDAKKETVDNIDDYLSQSTKTLTNKTIDAGSNTITGLVKGDVGLGNVDNTSDANKPISTATQTALDAKQATLVSGTNIKTVGGTSLLGSGNIILPGTGTVTSVSVVTANGISGSVATETTTPAITLDISGLDASKIADGSVSSTEFQYLGGVTSDIQTQINAKAPSTSPTFATSITGSYLTASEILGTDASKNIVSLGVSTYPSLTELAYVKGVTSSIQTQIAAKVTGPASATDNALVRYDSTTGKLIKNSTITDNGATLNMGSESMTMGTGVQAFDTTAETFTFTVA